MKCARLRDFYWPRFSVPEA